MDHDPIWFPPANIVHHYARLASVASQETKQTKPFRKATEAYYTSIFVIGIEEAENKPYYVQVVDDTEAFPDVRTAYEGYNDKGIRWLYTQDVKFTEYRPEEKHPISKFLLDVKLSKQKGYDEKTTVLCYVNQSTMLPSHQQINQELNHGSNLPCDVVLLYRIHPEKHIYRVVKVYPDLVRLQHDINGDSYMESWNAKRGILRVRKGVSREPNYVYVENEKHYPFEELGFN